MYKYSVSVLYLSMWARSDSGPCVERMFQEYREHPAELICNTGAKLTGLLNPVQHASEVCTAFLRSLLATFFHEETPSGCHGKAGTDPRPHLRTQKSCTGVRKPCMRNIPLTM